LLKESSERLTEPLNRVVLPERSPFEGIYLAGHFTLSKRFGQAEIAIKQLANPT